MSKTAEDIASKIDTADTNDTADLNKDTDTTGQSTDTGTEDKGSQDKSTEDKGKAYVPLNVLHKTRDEFQSKIQGLEEKLGKYADLEKRINQYYEEEEKNKKAKEIPDFEEQPSEHLRVKQQDLDKRYTELADGQKKITEQLSHQQQMQQLMQRISGNETAFVKENPDYYEALGFIRDKERERMALFGYGPEEIEQALAMGEIQTAAALMERGKSPAEYIYTLAKHFGYTNKQAEAEEKLDQVDKSMKASKTLGSGGRSIADVANSPKEEFDAIMSSIFKR